MRWLFILVLALAVLAVGVYIWILPRTDRQTIDQGMTRESSSPENQLRLANKAMEAKDYQGAERHLTACIDGLPDGMQRAIIFSLRGRARLFTGQHQQAVDDYDVAIRFIPQAPGLFRGRGEVYIALGEFEKAVADLSEAIRLAPFVPESFTLRAKAFRGLGKHADAKADDVKADALQQRH